MPLSCQRFSSGGSLGKLALPKALIFLASCDSLSDSVDLFTLNCFVVDPACVCVWLIPAGSLWRDIAPRWQRRTCGPWGRKTHRTRSSPSCNRSGRLNVPKSKSENWRGLNRNLRHFIQWRNMPTSLWHSNTGDQGPRNSIHIGFLVHKKVTLLRRRNITSWHTTLSVVSPSWQV